MRTEMGAVAWRWVVWAALGGMTQGCWLFKSRSDGDGSGSEVAAVLGGSLGSRAKDADESWLDSLRQIDAAAPPAPIRLDPDLHGRRLLRRFRPEGLAIAQAVSTIEAFRPLLGGASVDFKTTPQESFDATSLLAHRKVMESLCESLVAPSQSGWQTILPAPISDSDTNLDYLAVQILGLPEDRIAAESREVARSVLGPESEGLRRYILPCVALALDAEALFL